MEVRRYFLHLCYKGTNYSGWQSQPNQASIQREIEKALTAVHSNNPVAVTGCGRTDAGVHATNYYAHFDSSLSIDTTALKQKLNGMLGGQIAVLNVYRVSPTAHARFDAISRTYHYFVHFQNDPFREDRSWLVSRRLNVENMNLAALAMTGKRDFQCFSKVHTEVKNFICDVSNAQWIPTDKGLVFTITANRFLRGMVRAIVGTMMDVGMEKLSVVDFCKVLESADRCEAGMSVPAKGLFLTDVRYPNPFTGTNNI